MERPRIVKIAASCELSSLCNSDVDLRRAVRRDRVRGGSATGPIFELFTGGILLFVLSLPIVFASRQICGAVTVLASMFCLPLYLYVLAPGPFRWIFRGEYKTLLQTNFVWERWSTIGILALAAAAALAFWDLTKTAILTPPQVDAGSE